MAIKETLPALEKIRIFDISMDAMKRYKARYEKEFGFDITICDSVESAVDGMDLILTATQRLKEPIVKSEWFKPGCLGFGLEASRAWYGDAILGADKFITDSWGQTVHFYEQGAFPDGLPKLYAELGEIVAKKKSGRENSEERVLAINIGLALEDVIVANHIYEKVKDSQDVTRLTLMKETF